MPSSARANVGNEVLQAILILTARWLVAHDTVLVEADLPWSKIWAEPGDFPSQVAFTALDSFAAFRQPARTLLSR